MATVIIKSIGEQKISVIKVIRELTDCSLAEAKEISEQVDSGTEYYLENVNEWEVKKVIQTLSLAGAIAVSLEDENPPSNETTYKGVVLAKDVSTIDRETTLKVLVEARDIASELEGYDSDIKSLSAEILAKGSTLKEIQNAVSKGAKRIINIVTFVMAFLGFCVGSIFGALLLGIITRIILNLTIKKNDLKKHAEENNANAEKYQKEVIEPLLAKREYLYEKRSEIYDSGKRAWAIDVVGPDMFYSKCIHDLYELVKNRRADSVKEALNKYDDSLHKSRMEEMQSAIQNASEVSAIEISKQTAYMKEIEKNTHQTARAAKISAASNVGTYLNTRKKK